MNINIVKVVSHRQMKRFVKFPLKLYKNCENWVPALEGDEYITFNPKLNGAYDFCEADCFLAYRGDEIVGRIAAIINHIADDAEHIVRFGWLDFIEDEAVLRALIDAVSDWGRQRGRTEIRGPWGFTDMDKEGLLVEGFERLSPFTCIYNFPYYGTLLEKIGFTKDVDWIQNKLEVKPELPPIFKLSEAVEEKYHVHLIYPKSTREMAKRYGMKIFHMYNESFAPLNGFSPLTDKQITAYLKTYVPILDKDFVAVVVNDEDYPVGFFFCVPSLAKAVKKSNGRLFPFGLFRILKALKKNDSLDGLMIGVLPEYQQKGIPLLLTKYLHINCLKRGIKQVILNPQLEHNHKVQSIYVDFDGTPYMRRRAYKRPI